MDAKSMFNTVAQVTNTPLGSRSNWWFTAGVAVGAGTG